MAGSHYEHMCHIMEVWQRSARSVLSQFAVVPRNESFERRRQDHIVHTTGIKLEDCSDLWKFCRKKRHMGTGWRPLGTTAWQYSQCVDFVDCWLFADGSSNAETSTPLQIGQPGVYWPVVVGLPYPTPPDLLFPYACPALANGGRRCWLAHVSRLVRSVPTPTPPPPSAAPPSAAAGSSSAALDSKGGADETPSSAPSAATAAPSRSAASSSDISWAVSSQFSARSASAASEASWAPSSGCLVTAAPMPQPSSLASEASWMPSSGWSVTAAPRPPSPSHSSNSSESAAGRRRRWGPRRSDEPAGDSHEP